MELVKIEKLLEKYFDASTTVAEEKELQSYFSGNGVAPHLEKYRTMFAYFSEAREEQFTRPVPLNTKQRSNLYGWISVAAVAVICFGIYFGNEIQKQREIELAYEETQKAFELIAQNLDRGTEKISYLKKFDDTKNKILINE